MTYTIRGYSTEDTLRGCDCDTTADTLRDAKLKARDYVTERLDNEFKPCAYATVTNEAGECVWDVFAKRG